MEQQLGKTPYIAGSSFTLADIGFLPYIEYLFAAGHGDLITSRPHVADWWTRSSTRPSWQTAIGKSAAA
jgi:glutathione S-transferase